MTDQDEVSLPHAVALSWGIAEQPHRGPKRELSIERIVEAAVEIADAEGLGALSMNRVATSLGFTTMSLYRYITSKDDLLLLMQDAVVDIPAPPEPETADWRAEFGEWVRMLREVFRGHRWLVDVPISGVPLTPNNLKAVDWGVRSFRATTLSDPEKLGTILLAQGYARTYAKIEIDLQHTLEAGGTIEGAMGSDYSAALLELVSEERFPYLRPLVLSGSYAGPPELDDQDDFEFGLERILDGIQHYLEHGHEDRATSGPTSEQKASAARVEFYPKDERVREAAHARREAEVKLREAQKREREAILKAREKADKAAEADARRAAKAADAAERQAAKLR
jgi:AcrR family transcriptional regulator